MNSFSSDRRNFLTQLSKGVGLATLSFAPLQSLLFSLEASAQTLDGLSLDDAAKNEKYWSSIQQAFSVSRETINLNNAGVGTSPRLVTEALVRYTWQQEELPSHMLWAVLEPQTEVIRTGLAHLFECHPEEIAITRNASDSLEALLLGLNLKPGDEVIACDQEYDRMLMTLRQRVLRDGIVLKKIKIPTQPNGSNEIVERYEKAITKKTKLILVSHMLRSSGQILPVKEIVAMAKSRGGAAEIEVVVDGAQSFGHLDFKQADLDCDYFGASLHKWFLGPKGTGMLYIKQDKIENVWPLMAAENSQSKNIRKFEETGTRSAAPRLALGEALLFHGKMGAKLKEERLRFLTRTWRDAFATNSKIRIHTPASEKLYCGIATFEIEGIEPAALQAYLLTKHKILTSTVSHEDFKGVRISPSLCTTVPELHRFCEVIETVATKGHLS